MKLDRREEHKSTEQLKYLLNEINGLLSPVEEDIVRSYDRNKFPVVLVMGAPRSGTTLLMQWLASTGCFSYPTNLLSRFYAAPYIGAKIQLMLTRHDFNNEIFDFNEEVPFSSNLGKTKGALAPNEFWYFWRRFFKFDEIQKLSEVELSKVDHKTFVAELAAIEAAFGKPFATKGMLLNWNIPYLSEIFDKVIFIHIVRHPLYNIQSLLGARLNYYGDIKGWYSFKPPEYSELKSKDPYEQVAGQIFHTNNAVKEGLKAVGEAKVISIGYEEFCQAPGVVFEAIKDRFRQQGCESDWSYTGPATFVVNNKITLKDEEFAQAVSAYEKLSGEKLTL